MGSNANIHEEAHSAAPGWDMRYFEVEWHCWCATQENKQKNPSRHVVRFCRTWYEIHVSP